MRQPVTCLLILLAGATILGFACGCSQRGVVAHSEAATLPPCPRLAVLVYDGRTTRAVVSSGNKVRVVPHISDVTGISWVPSASALLVATVSDVWRVEVARDLELQPVRVWTMSDIAGVPRDRGAVHNIACSPDGKLAAIEAESQIYLLNLRDPTEAPFALPESAPHSVGMRGQEPVWSPDGRYVAFQSFSRGESDICVYDLLQRRTQRVVTSAPDQTAHSPSWASDSVRIAYSRSRRVTTGLPPGSGAISLPPSLRIASVSAPSDVEILPADHWVRDPQWRPNSEEIVFAGTTRSRLQVVRSNGTDLHEVATPGLGPSWSSDGKWLTFCARPPPGKMSYIVVMRMSDGRKWTVLESVDHLYWPVLEPSAPKASGTPSPDHTDPEQ